jgi:hypothetical protein
MKLLLVALQLSLTPPVPVPGAESTVSTPQPEEQKRVVIDFDDDSIEDLDPVSSGWECFPDHRQGRWSRLIRIREDFDDKVMQSMAEM